MSVCSVKILRPALLCQSQGPEKLVTVRRQRSHGILRAFFHRFEIYTLASTPSKLAVLHGSRKKKPETSPSKPRFGGSMFDFRRFLLETFVCRQAMDMEMLGLPKSPRVMTQAPQESIRNFTVVGSMIFNTPRGVDQISPIDSFCYWLFAKTFQK